MNLNGATILFLAIILLLILLPWKSKGKRGEIKVSKELRRSLDQDEYCLVEDVTLPISDGTTQIDQLIISPYGVFVIETKNMSGWIFGDKNQAQWTQQIYQHKQKFQNPLRQNYKHVTAVRELLALGPYDVFNVVVFVGDSTFKTQMPDNVLHGVKALTEFIESKREPLLSVLQVQGLIDTILHYRLPPGAQTNSTHIENLQRQALLCPHCGAEMVERTNKRSGDQFLGCQRYPQCQGTRLLP